jgi:hypothetical protein
MMKTLASTIKQSTQQKGGMKNKERERERERESTQSLGQESKTQRVHRNKLCFIKHKKHIRKRKEGKLLRAISLERALIATMMQTKVEVTCIFYKAINTLYLEVTCVLYKAADTLC